MTARYGERAIAEALADRIASIGPLSGPGGFASHNTQRIVDALAPVVREAVVAAIEKAKDLTGQGYGISIHMCLDAAVAALQAERP